MNNIELLTYFAPYFCIMIFYCIVNYRIDKVNDEIEKLNRLIRKKADKVDEADESKYLNGK